MLFLWALMLILVVQERDLLAAADPVRVFPGSVGRGSWCNEHDTIHKRLDIIEETVIKTVEHLESEVKSLLNTISETTMNIPIPPGTPLPDIFDGCEVMPSFNSVPLRPQLKYWIQF
ncbi:placenta-specific protein 9 isoform X1 [Apus apus]|uniref:placenta-specific protein 9 isoform X1 n=1 Tax=Apus apus TaxID=8895 RepID=UPI0021F8D4F9|nr:placenta-specific protein 9 isoform X1 [Apus apus]